MKKVVNLYRMDPSNVGDLHCAALCYFDIPGFVKHFADIQDHGSITGNEPIIVGGGGILYFAHIVEKVASTSGPHVFWGAGMNQHGTMHSNYPHWLNAFSLIGVRDFGKGYRWVPCPSCMHQQFDVKREISEEIVIFDHVQHRVPVTGFKRIANTGQSLRWLSGCCRTPLPVVC